MWIVRLALRRPYTFVVLALLIAVLGIVSIATMIVDIFPAINIPVVTVIWNYSGLSPTEMQGRIVTVSERAFTTTVNGIEHIESVSLRGTAITRLYFHPIRRSRRRSPGQRSGAADRAGPAARASFHHRLSSTTPPAFPSSWRA
jgi:multidrug efflux pump subunit AcrB